MYWCIDVDVLPVDKMWLGRPKWMLTGSQWNAGVESKEPSEAPTSSCQGWQMDATIHKVKVVVS